MSMRAGSGSGSGFGRRAARAAVVAFAAVIALVAALALYSWWVVASFDTTRLPARHGQVNARLFAPPGAPRPLIVGLGGGEGGNPWADDAWKAQRERFIAQGYAVLALGYFGMPGTPERLDRISIDAVHAAIETATRDPGVDGRCIALIGGSRGAELSLLLGSRYPDIKAVVAIVPSSVVFPGDTDAMTTSGFSYRDKPLPFVPMPWDALPDLLANDRRGAFETMIENEAAAREAAIPVERISGPIYFVSASDDEMWPSRDMSDAMMRRLRAHAFPYAAEHLVVPGGHAEPLDEFPRIEAFLRTHFMHDGRGCAEGK